MRLTISPSEWNVLVRQLIAGGVNTFNANRIISKHKKILNDFKEKLEYAKAVELEKFKRELDKKQIKDRSNKIIKFESKKDEELQEIFKTQFYKISQEFEGKYC